MQRARLVATIVIAMALVSVSAGIWWFVEPHPGGASPRPTIRADGPALLQAFGDVNQSIRKETGGPWHLFWFVGVAAQAPFSPNVVGYGLQVNLTANACGDQYNGLTLWNGTIPTFDGTFDSGTAPFWQFAFYSNSTGLTLLATNVLGVVTIYPPENITSDVGCYPWDDAPNPRGWVQALTGLPTDSPTLVQNAIARINQTWWSRQGPVVEIMTTGPGAFTAVAQTIGSIGVFYQQCGLEGIAGITPDADVYEGLNGSFTGLFNGTTNCAYLNHPYFAGYGSYKLLPSPSTKSQLDSTLQVTTPFQVALTYPNGSIDSYDGWGLANWMTSWNLTDSSSSPLPLSGPSCASWVVSVQQCLANSTGWYLVVLSEGGKWINSYGLLQDGKIGWSEPVTALVSHYQLVAVTPSSWNLTGDTLSVASTVPTSTVVGSITF